MSRSILLACVVGLLGRSAEAQLAPTGNHYGARPSDTGSGTNPSGGHAASIPFEFPPARGGLPLPVQIVSGTRGFGAAGLGWDLPLSFVQDDTFYAYHRPAANSADSAPQARERLVLSLLGRSLDMVPKGSDFIARRGAPDIKMRKVGTDWYVYDGAGRTYRFVYDSHLSGTGLYLLFSIKGPGGAMMVLDYGVTAVNLPGAPPTALPAIAIDLQHVDYNPNPTTAGCYKHDLTFVYEAAGTTPLSLSVVGERVLVRLHKLRGIDVAGRDTCTTAQRLRSYVFSYVTDPDTQQPRLSAVRLRGRQGTSENGVYLPVANYTYGTATYNAAGSPPVLRYQKSPQSIPIPAGADNTQIGSTVYDASISSPVSGSTAGYGTWQSLLDLTGDGRPDLVYRSGDQLWVARNLPGVSGATTLGLVNTQLTDATLAHGALEKRSAARVRFSGAPVDSAVNIDYVWRRAMDVNGDGRVDIVDAAEQAGHWVVYLNQPDSGPSGVKWLRRSFKINALYQHLHDRGMVVENNYVPLSRRYTGRDYGTNTCWFFQNGGWISRPDLLYTPDCFPTTPELHGPEQTYVEWDVQDVNGDGYPDVVLNSSPVQFVDQGPPPLAPGEHHVDGERTPGQVIMRLQPTDGALNRIDAMLNVRGVQIASDINTDFYPFSLGILLKANTACGVARWTEQSASEQTQVQSCALTDVNGDGLVDRVEDNQVSLGNALGFNLATFTLPGPLASHKSGQPAGCTSPANFFTSTQLAGLRDLTGDGIPDLVQKVGGAWQVSVGTGVGFAAAIAIQGGFDLSSESENCGGSISGTTQGLFDIDGDGRPDTVALNGANLDVYQLAGGTTPRTPEAGRIVAVDNGYGAVTSISYISAKEDGIALHQVPFPEIVVASTETTGTRNLGGTLTATRYAYGGAEMYYDSALDAFTLPGYRRTVELRAIPGGLEPEAGASIVDLYPVPKWTAAMTQNQRIGRYLRGGQTSDVTVLAGSLGSDPWALLAVDVTSDSRRLAGTHYDVDTNTYSEPALAGELCLDVYDPYDYDTSAANNIGQGYTICSAHGFVHPTVTDSWRGQVAPPLAANVEIRTAVRSVDDFGRVTSALYENDLYDLDDDFCVDTTYAVPNGVNERVLTAEASRKIWDCGGRTTFAYETSTFDNLVWGNVSSGFVTGHDVERHATDTGIILGTIHEFDAVYDAQGNPSRITRTREDGASQVTTIDYDPFGLVPIHSALQGSNTPLVETSHTLDVFSLELLSRRDANGTERGNTFDGFGRPLTATVKPPGGATGVLASFSYLGFVTADPLGRRVAHTRYTEAVDPATLATAPGRTSTNYFDELGRSRFTRVALGSDYANETMIAGARTFDALGRVIFEADPYPASQDPVTAYGTTRYFNLDGTPWCFVRGRGPQAFTTVPDDASERYPVFFSHSFANHIEQMSVLGTDALTVGSQQEGVVRASLTSAIGRPLFGSTWRNGVRLEHQAFQHDKLGRLRSFNRFLDASNGANPVGWDRRLDSLGQVVSLWEPDSAEQTRTYSNWGELIRTDWTPAAPEPSHSVTHRFDALGRLTHAEEQNGGATDPLTVNDYDYDVGRVASPQVTPTFVLGRMAHASAPTGEVFFSYDALGRANARTFTDESGAWYVEKHTFHGDGSTASVELDLPDRSYTPEHVDYGYDSAARMRSMLFSDGTSTRTLYNAQTRDAFGRLRNAAFGQSTYVAHYADLGRRLLQDVTVSSPLGSRSVTMNDYDALTREAVRTETGPNAGTVFSDYSALGRLGASVKLTNGGSTTASRWGYGYDPLGNVVTMNDYVGQAGATMTYLTTDRDRICRINYAGNGFGGTGCTVDYDSFGNVKREPTRANGYRDFTYFNAGGVRHIQDVSGASADFRYGALGGVQELDVTSLTETRSDRRYGGLIARRSQSSGGLSTSYLSRSFPGPGVSVSRRGPAGPWIFVFAEQRGTHFTTDENGNFVQDLDYQPYGETRSSGAQAGSAQYSSEQWNGGDALLSFGLVHLGARLYDPVIGRFLSRDPLVVPRTAATTNPYAFAMNDPINRSDPSGLDPPPNCSPDGLCITNNYPIDSNNVIAAAAAGLGFLWGLIDGSSGDGPSGQPAAPPSASASFASGTVYAGPALGRANLKDSSYTDYLSYLKYTRYLPGSPYELYDKVASLDSLDYVTYGLGPVGIPVREVRGFIDDIRGHSIAYAIGHKALRGVADVLTVLPVSSPVGAEAEAIAPKLLGEGSGPAQDELGQLRALQDFFEGRGIEMRTLTLNDGTVTARTPGEEFRRAMDVAEEFWRDGPYADWSLAEEAQMVDVIEDGMSWTNFFRPLTRD